MAHVDLADKQNVAHARLTFSEEVEMEMKKNNDTNEANFCRLVRNWYDAEDTHGIDCSRRTQLRLEMWTWLLGRYHPSHFPPPSSYVGGIPIVTFEALLTNVERKLQLYNFVNCYNPRSVSTLDVENFFSALGDLAPGGRSLTIRPSDLPNVLQSACDLAVLHSNPRQVCKFAIKAAHTFFSIFQFLLILCNFILHLVSLWLLDGKGGICFCART